MVYRINTRLEDKNGDIIWNGGKTVHAQSLEQAVERASFSASRPIDFPDNTTAVVITVMVRNTH